MTEGKRDEGEIRKKEGNFLQDNTRSFPHVPLGQGVDC